MYKIGCCVPGYSFMPQGVGEVSRSSYDIVKSGVKKTLENGFDFAEATVGLIMSLTDEEIAQVSEIRNLEEKNLCRMQFY